MKEKEIEPQVKKRFFLKNLWKIIRLKLSNRSKINRFIAETEVMNEPLLELFEGTGGPMEEGMIYLLFDAENGSSDPSDFDTVFRIFWILAPDLTYHQIDSFIVSTNPNVGSHQWRRFSEKNFFKNLSKKRFHQETSIEPIDFTFDGIYDEGYSFQFDDRLNGLSGTLTYDPIEKGTLVYYNGREAVAPQLLQKFYDTFGIEVKGSISYGDKEITLDGGRGVIEHGLGIFGIENIYEWRWMNLQGKNSSIHLFYHPLTLNDGGEIIEAGEGAAIIDGTWFHYLIDDFAIDELEYETDENIPTKVPVKWRVKAGFNSEDDSKQIELQVNELTHHSWQAEAAGTTRHFTTNYFLEFEGKVGDQSISGRGTMEYLFERVIE